MRKKILVVLSCCFLVYLCLLFLIIYKQDAFEPKPADAILILGYSLDNGILPGDYLTERLQTGLALYQDGYAPVIIVSGGKGPNDSVPVARSMAKWLVNKGVQEDAIYIEENARNTYENFLFSKSLADENNISSVIVVTNDFHMYRSMMIAKDHFGEVSAQTARVGISPEKIGAYIKEPFSVIKYMITKQRRVKL